MANVHQRCRERAAPAPHTSRSTAPVATCSRRTTATGHNSIVGYTADSAGALSLPTHTPTEGMTPRSFVVDPAGAFLMVANQASSSLVPFVINRTTGALTRAAASAVTLTTPKFIGVVASPAQ